MLAFVLYPRQALVVEDRFGTISFAAPMRIGDRFSVNFIHSLAKSPVEEVFEVIGDREFQLKETIYADFGAGLPHEELPGQKMEFGGGRIRITGYASKFNELYVRVGRIAEHTLVIGNDSLRLRDMEQPGGAVRLAVLPCFYGQWHIWNARSWWYDMMRV